MKLTDHFSLDELIHSDTAIRQSIDQTPPPVVLNALVYTASQMEVVRALLGNKEIRINSGYRSPRLNALVGGAHDSAHLSGYAVDFTCAGFGSLQKAAKFLSLCPTLKFDQLIYEGTWVHISFAPTARREVLTARFVDGHAIYTKGIV